MEIIEAIRSRRSIRKYQERAIEPERLMRVLDAGRIAPSAKNLQDWKFIVVRDGEKRRRLAEAAMGQAQVAAAPVVIAACATKPDNIMPCGQLCYPIDLAIATRSQACGLEMEAAEDLYGLARNELREMADAS